MAVAVPYQCLGICGNIIIAAQGSRIRSFNTKLELLASWRHPGKTAAEGAKETTGPNLEDGSPPAKRRRTSAADVSGVPEAQDEDRAQSADGVPALPPPTYGKKGKSKKQAKPSRQVESLDRPFVQNLRATPEGRHVVAVTGTDKTLWVFEHDGQGNLKLLSQRYVWIAGPSCVHSQKGAPG